MLLAALSVRSRTDKPLAELRPTRRLEFRHHRGFVLPPYDIWNLNFRHLRGENWFRNPIPVTAAGPPRRRLPGAEFWRAADVHLYPTRTRAPESKNLDVFAWHVPCCRVWLMHIRASLFPMTNLVWG